MWLWGGGMARGRDRHQARLDEVSRLGRPLSRRAASRCELCDARSGLRGVEVAPVFEEPDLDRLVLVCARCEALFSGGKLPRDTADLRFLEGVIWSEILPVQLVAVRALRRLVADDVAWASDAMWVGQSCTPSDPTLKRLSENDSQWTAV